MAEPFRDRSDQTRGRLAGLGAARRKKRFLEQLETELARAEALGAVEEEAVRALAQENGVDLESDLLTARRSLYRRFLEYCLNDYALSGEESEALAHLKTLLALRDPETEAAHEEAVRSVYGHALDDVLADHHLDPDEEEFLRRLRNEVGLSETSAQELVAEAKRRARERFLKDAVVHDSSLVVSQQTEVELKGDSALSFDAAVGDAIAKAYEVVPKIRSATLRGLDVEVENGSVRKWSVALRARL